MRFRTRWRWLLRLASATLFETVRMNFCPLRALVEEHLPIADHGSGIFSDDMFIPRSITMPLRSGYLRSWRHQPIRRSGKSHIRKWKGGFEVNLDVQHFKPDEVSVKIRDDFIVIEGNHEERQDQHGFISRQFTRRYKLPENTDIDAVTSRLSSDGVLTIKAPKKAPLKDSTERVVPIVQTNKPAVTKAGHENPDDKQVPTNKPAVTKAGHENPDDKQEKMEA